MRDNNSGRESNLQCTNNHSFSVIDGIPVLLTGEEEGALDANVKEAFTDMSVNYESTIDYELRKYWGLEYRVFIDRICSMIGETKPVEILDLATGTARIPRNLTNTDGYNPQVTGIDITFPVLSIGRRLIERSEHALSIDLVCASALRLPFADERFDAISCGLATHHMDVDKMLSESYRVLKKNGRIIIADVVATEFFRSRIGRFVLSILLLGYVLTQKKSRAKAEKDAFYTLKTQSEWIEALVSAGFSEIKAEPIHPRKPYYPGGIFISAVRR
jgi:ubiquinone/menaquinone biosynthesis C-methylase UbiE